MDTTRPSLLLRIRDPNDGAAWRLFDSIYRPLLIRFATGRGLSAADAEEIAQQCLAEVNQRIGSFEYDPGKGRFKGWLRTMAENRVRNWVRDRRRHVAAEDLSEMPARDGTPADEFDRLWMQEHLWFCLGELRAEVGEKSYQAFHAYVIEQRPAEDVCGELGLSPGNLYTIKWRLTERVAARMKELLGDEAED